jgi:Lipopolysaccharide assembly protein A domain
MLRKFVTALILVPLAVVVAALAVANRQPVLVSFDPFDQLHPAMARALPLYQLMLLLLVVGVVVGGVAAWARQGKWRRAARLADAQARELRAEVDRLRRLAPAELAPVPVPAPADQTPRLSVPPAA